MLKNKILLRIETVLKENPNCPLSQISAFYELKYHEKLNISETCGAKKMSKLCELYNFNIKYVGNIQQVSPSNRLWF